MPQARSWHLLPGQRLQYRQWDREAVLFNDLSGDTHLLDADALAVLLAMQGGASDLASLRAALESESEGTDDAAAMQEEADAALQALLEQLASIALIAQRR